MTQQTQEDFEPQANPYNARKAWHDVEEREVQTANEMYYEEETTEKATQDSAPSNKRQRGKSTNYKKRYDDLKRHYDEKIAEFKQREQELIAQASIAQQPQREEVVRETYQGEVSQEPEPQQSKEQRYTPEELDVVKEKLSKLEEREARIARQEAEAKLRERHPDFAQIRDDENFHAWAKEQPQEIQNWIYRNPDNVNLASRAIDFYKMEKGIKIHEEKSSAKRPETNAADFVSTKTTGVDTKQPKIWTQKEISKLSMDDFERFEAEIDLAIREGRVR